MFNFVANVRKRGIFRARSAERDAATDLSRFTSILKSIEQSLSDAQTERSGLQARLNDVLSRAVIATGNGDDEYLSRDALDTHQLNLLDVEMKNARRRIDELTSSIANFLFLKQSLLSRFPDFAPDAGRGQENDGPEGYTAARLTGR